MDDVLPNKAPHIPQIRKVCMKMKSEQNWFKEMGGTWEAQFYQLLLKEIVLFGMHIFIKHHKPLPITDRN